LLYLLIELESIIFHNIVKPIPILLLPSSLLPVIDAIAVVCVTVLGSNKIMMHYFVLKNAKNIDPTVHFEFDLDISLPLPCTV
jgi:hypothetical protein